MEVSDMHQDIDKCSCASCIQGLPSFFGAACCAVLIHSVVKVYDFAGKHDRVFSCEALKLLLFIGASASRHTLQL